MRGLRKSSIILPPKFRFHFELLTGDVHPSWDGGFAEPLLDRQYPFVLIIRCSLQDQNIIGTTVDAGISYTTEGIDITIDYTYRSVQLFDANQVISLKLGF